MHWLNETDVTTKFHRANWTKEMAYKNSKD